MQIHLLNRSVPSRQLLPRDDRHACPYLWSVNKTAVEAYGTEFPSSATTAWANISPITSITGSSTVEEVDPATTSSSLPVTTAAVQSSTVASAVSVTSFSHTSTKISTAVVAASTVLGNQAKEAELCQQDCVSAFGSCSTAIGKVPRRGGVNVMDCGAVGNCYCFTEPFVAGSTNVDMEMAAQLCSGVSIITLALPCD